MDKKNKIKNLLILHVLLVLYSLTGIFSKLAGGQRVFSFEFIKYYLIEFAILFFYAIGWQQIIKKVSLTTAFINKSVTIFWGMIWGVLLFGENITAKKVVSFIFVIVGMVIYAKGDEI
mgnify:CR=1 FL=1